MSQERVLSVGSALGIALGLFGCGGVAGTFAGPSAAGLTSQAAGPPRFVRAAAWIPQPTYASLPADGQAHTFTFTLRPQDFGDPATAAPGTVYANPITLTLTESGGSGHATLLLDGSAVGAKATVTSSGQTVALRYDGRGFPTYTTLTTMTAPGFYANAVRVSPLYVTPFDNHWPSEAALTPPQLVVLAPAINEHLGASEVDAPASITYSARPSSGCVNVATVSMKGSLATVTGGLRPALLGTCNIVISDGSSAVTAAIENRIAGPDRTGDATLTTYWPPDLSDVSGTGSDIGGFVRGPNGAIYFWDDAGAPPKIGRITTSGTIVEVPAPPGQRGFGIAAGSDGNLWVTSLGFSIDRVTMNGAFTSFPTPQAASAAMAIAAGPDGNLWFTTFGGQQLCRITTAGVVTEFALPNGSSTSGVYPFISITTGPDGNLWFGAGSAVGRSTPSGTITMFPVTPNSNPNGITSGPDGNLWFAEEWGNAIGRITPAGTVTEFPLPTPNTSPESIVAAPDGNLWFTLQAGNAIGKISVSGTITEYSIPNIASNGVLMVGSDGNLWLGNDVSMQKLQIP